MYGLGFVYEIWGDERVFDLVRGEEGIVVDGGLEGSEEMVGGGVGYVGDIVEIEGRIFVEGGREGLLGRG